MRRIAYVILAVALGTGIGSPVAASAARESGPTPPRLSFLDGEVSFWRPGAEDWAPAQRNTPLAAGDALYTGDDGNLELQIGPSAFVRAGSGTELGLESLDNGVQQFRVTSGHAAVDAQRIPKNQAIEIDTPNGAFTIDHPGYYRIDVDDDRTSFVARRGGRATVIPANGDERDIDPDTRLTLVGTDTPEIASARAPDSDDWDRWNLDRGRARPEKPRSAQYVPADVAGADELDEYGDWREEPEYGHVWVPRATPADWVPYSTGRWVYDPYYGWTWIDDAPWGWAPYHYGRWVFVNGYWGWAPGPVIAAPVYAPALVVFYGGPHVTVSVGTPFVGWVALGWGEPVIPWWGPVGFHGRCWWGGWGGPRVVNNVVIQRNTYVNVRNVNVFRNARHPNAIVGVPHDRFGRGRVERLRFAGGDVQKLRPVHGRLDVRPTPASLVPREGRGRRPPEQVHARPVVATRAPQDSSHRLRAAGLKVPDTATRPARIVRQPNRQRAGGPESDHRRGGQAEVGARPRGSIERNTERSAPPPPRAQHGGAGERPERAARPRPPDASPRAERGHAPAVQQPKVEQPPSRRGRQGGEVEVERAPRNRRDVERAERSTPMPPPHARPTEPSRPAKPSREAPSHGGFERQGGNANVPRHDVPSERTQPPPRSRPPQSAKPHGGGGHGGMPASPGGAPHGGVQQAPPPHGGGHAPHQVVPGGGGGGGPSARRHERRGRRGDA